MQGSQDSIGYGFSAAVRTCVYAFLACNHFKHTFRPVLFISPLPMADHQEAFINIRKGKMIPSYELEIKLKWSGELKDGSGSSVGSGSGVVHLPYVADENHDEAPEIKVSCNTADSSSQRLKDLLLGKGKQVRAGFLLQAWIRAPILVPQPQSKILQGAAPYFQ